MNPKILKYSTQLIKKRDTASNLCKKNYLTQLLLTHQKEFIFRFIINTKKENMRGNSVDLSKLKIPKQRRQDTILEQNSAITRSSKSPPASWPVLLVMGSGWAAALLSSGGAGGSRNEEVDAAASTGAFRSARPANPSQSTPPPPAPPSAAVCRAWCRASAPCC
jgi:hypothetical protein